MSDDGSEATRIEAIDDNDAYLDSLVPITVPPKLNMTQTAVDYPAPIYRRPEDGLALRKGMMIVVNESRTIRTNHCVRYYARIDAIREPVRKRESVFLNIVPYYSSKDLSLEWLSPSTRRGNRAKTITSDHQLVRGSKVLPIWPSQVAYVAAVWELNHLTADVPIMLPGTLWTREDLSIEMYKSGQDTRYARLKTMPNDFCHPECRFERSYAPEFQIARYCEDCAMWFHVECLEQRDNVEHYQEHPIEGMPRWIAFEFPVIEPRSPKKIVSRLINTPIQRGYPDHGSDSLLTFETFLLWLRSQMDNDEFEVPEDKEGYLMWLEDILQMHTYPPTTLYAKAAMDWVRRLPLQPMAERMLYQCPFYPEHLI